MKSNWNGECLELIMVKEVCEGASELEWAVRVGKSGEWKLLRFGAKMRDREVSEQMKWVVHRGRESREQRREARRGLGTRQTARERTLTHCLCSAERSSARAKPESWNMIGYLFGVQ